MSEIKIISPYDEKISSALVKENITDAVIEKMKEEFLPMKLKDLSDREGYLNISEARKQVKNFRVSGVKIFKKGREEANAESKAWVAKEKEFVDKIDPIETHLENQEKSFEAEAERKKAEEKRKKDEQLFTRQLQLTKMGAHLIDGSFVLEDVSIEGGLIREASVEVYNESILPLFDEVFQKNEKIRIAQEEDDARRKEEEEEERQRLILAQQELERERQAIRKQQQELEEAKRIAQNQRTAARVSQLQNIGLVPNIMGTYILNMEEVDINISPRTIKEISDEEWNLLIATAAPLIESAKIKAAQQRAIELEKIKQKAIEDAKEEENERLRLEEIKKLEEIAAATDKEKWKMFIESIKGISLHEMKSSAYRKKMAMAKEKITEILSL